MTHPEFDRHARVKDVLLWLVLVSPAAAQIAVHAFAGTAWLHMLAGALVLGGVVVISRRWPATALLLSVVLCVLDPSFVWSPVALSYLAGRRSETVRPVLVVFAGITAVRCGLVLVLDFDLGTVAETVVAVAFLGVAPWLVGRYRRQYAALTRMGWERAEHLEKEQRAVAEQARMRERARIAEDMHDSLGHELSLLALQSGALEVDDSLDERHRESASVIRTRAGKATESLRTIIDVLREDTGAPVDPAGESVENLVRRAGESGLDVHVETSGAEDAPNMVERAVYRVVQEGLTNATKHAPGNAIHVRLHRGADLSEVTVTNDVLPRHQDGRDGGRGLAGLRERARLLGGTVRACEQDGTFELHAHLPHSAAPLARESDVDSQSESEQQHRKARSEFRREVVVGTAALGILALITLLGQMGIYVRNAMRAELSPEHFVAMQIGQHRDEIVPLLPEAQIVEDRSGYPPTPPSQQCEFYGSGTDLFGDGDVYRLCFDQQRLVSKENLSEGDRS